VAANCCLSSDITINFFNDPKLVCKAGDQCLPAFVAIIT
jgi:hypothetical protein